MAESGRWAVTKGRRWAGTPCGDRGAVWHAEIDGWRLSVEPEPVTYGWLWCAARIGREPVTGSASRLAEAQALAEAAAARGRPQIAPG